MLFQKTLKVTDLLAKQTGLKYLYNLKHTYNSLGPRFQLIGYCQNGDYCEISHTVHKKEGTSKKRKRGFWKVIKKYNLEYLIAVRMIFIPKDQLSYKFYIDCLPHLPNKQIIVIDDIRRPKTERYKIINLDIALVGSTNQVFEVCKRYEQKPLNISSIKELYNVVKGKNS